MDKPAHLPAHSPLGASGAERWMNCPGSVTMISLLKMEQSDEPEYREDGTRAHAVAAKCLTEGSDAWEHMDDKFTAEHSLAVQVYLDAVRPLIASATVVRVEEGFYRPDLHKHYHGTADLALYFEQAQTLDITDYKHGEGIEVDVEWNPQIMYYAFGLLDSFPEARRIKLRIVQPRVVREDYQPIREWEIDANELRTWAKETLLPAMDRTAIDKTLDPGDHCRFCPAKLICPMLSGLFEAACKADPLNVKEMTDEQLARDYTLISAVKFRIKALEIEAHARLQKGRGMGGVIKLVAKKANRVLKSGAEAIFKARFGDAAYTKPGLKSPPELEKLGSDAKELVKEWAYTPLTGTTVALASDKRAAIPVRSATEAFAGYIEKELADE
jgi:hypothetical protein